LYKFDEAMTISESTADDKRSSLAEDGRRDLPTCGSVSPIAHVNTSTASATLDPYEEVSVFYSDKSLKNAEEAEIRKGRREEETWESLVYISAGLLFLSPVGFIAAREEWIGLVTSLSFIILSLIALVLGIVKRNEKTARNRRDYIDFSCDGVPGDPAGAGVKSGKPRPAGTFHEDDRDGSAVKSFKPQTETIYEEDESERTYQTHSYESTN